MDSVELVRNRYDELVLYEWERLARHSIEFALNKRFIDRYLSPGDRALDLGGGPGRYALHEAARGVEVTLADLSPNNVAFAQKKAKEAGLRIDAICADARDLSQFPDHAFDHVLCMGPLYHLKFEGDRIRAVEECLRVLKPGGTLTAAFISSYSGVLHYLKNNPAAITSPARINSVFEVFLRDTEFSGTGFSENHFARHADILPFFSGFPLTALHLLGSESIFSPYEPILLQQSPEVLEAWLDLGEQVCQREDLLAFAEHYLYIGRKT
jgi:ubiquinone/menaquinone biosynthesis C-methylase UbiE